MIELRQIRHSIVCFLGLSSVHSEISLEVVLHRLKLVSGVIVVNATVCLLRAQEVVLESR